MVAERTLFIIGAGTMQLPAYRVGRRMGLRIVGIDANPEAPGLRLADRGLVVDTRDADGAVEVARAERIDAVITLCTDLPVRTVAAVAKALRLPGLTPEVALGATHKGLMREAFATAGAPSPAFRRVREEEDAIEAARDVGLPAIVKPVDGSGSSGVYKVDDLAQVAVAVRHARAGSRGDPELVVEAYVEGPEVSVETASFGGEHHVVTITDKRTSGAPHFVEAGHCEPSRLPPAVQDAIIDAVHRGLDALGVMDSISHAEVRVGPDGPVLVEIGARLGGDFITTELVPRSTGVDLVRAAIELALGRTPNVTPTRKRGAAVHFLTGRPGVVKRIEGVEEATRSPGAMVVEVSLEPGEVVQPVTASQHRAGWVIAEGETPADAERAAETAASKIHIEVEEDPARG